MEFIKELFSYLSENPVMTGILIACFVFIAIVIAIICFLAVKAKKATLALNAPPSSAPETITVATEKSENEEDEVADVPNKTETDAPIALATEEVSTDKEKIPATESAPIKDNVTVSAKENSSRYSGKWTICHLIVQGEEEKEETYFFELHASNGEKLLSSEEYTSYNGVLKGIETHKANILKNNFRIGLTKKGDYIFKLLSGKNTLLCTGENYPTKARCERAIESTKRFAQSAVIDENVHDVIVRLPLEQEETSAPIPDNGYLGKWIVSKTVSPDGDEVFYFELFASNGEKLLSSEEYTSYIGAVNGIETHKSNIEKGNFRISFTKRGDYIYKILTRNGQLLCLGEHYKTKRRCESAVESVKRFAKNAPIQTTSDIAQE